MDRHLGIAHELTWFAMNMAEQLEAHQREKTPLREVELVKVQKLVVDEISLRIKLISGESNQQKIEKQCVHIANYAMMLFLRSKYNV